MSAAKVSTEYGYGRSRGKPHIRQATNPDRALCGTSLIPGSQTTDGALYVCANCLRKWASSREPA